MTRASCIAKYQSEFPADLAVDSGPFQPAVLVSVGLAHWTRAVTVARAKGGQFAAFWIDCAGGDFAAFCCLRFGGDQLLLHCVLPMDGKLPSITPVFAAADRPERHARDLFGVDIAGAPDDRRWTRHRAWGGHEWPLRGTPMAAAPRRTPPDDSYRFVSARGNGIVEIPVGPVHAGIIEPGHFHFHTMGETVLNLEERLGYVHKGIEHVARGRDASGLVRLAARVSGDSTVAHSWAACQALERAHAIEIPQRALWLRALMVERERVANHLGDIGAICNDVGFAFPQAQLTRLKEDWVRESHAAFGHRFMMDCVVPGGVRHDIGAVAASAMSEHAARLDDEFAGLIERFESSESLEDRLMTSGRLSPQQAAGLGVVGYVGKASGQAYDARRDVRYAPYDELEVEVPAYHAGDVAARAKIRADEVIVSLRLIRQIIERLPDGDINAEVDFDRGPAAGLGVVEAWRGEIVTFVRTDAAGRVARFYPRDPSWLNWPALEVLQQGNIVADFPVCNKSVNGSYSGQDL